MRSLFLHRITVSLFVLWACCLMAPQNPALRAQTVRPDREQQMARAQGAIHHERYDEALHILQGLLRENPQDAEAEIWMARVESWRSNYAAAEHTYRKILAERPGDSEASIGLADVLRWQGRHSESEALLQELLGREPDNAEALLRMARLSVAQGQQGRALDYYRAALALQTGDAEARQEYENLAAQKRFSLTAGYFHEAFNFAANTNGSFVELLYRNWNNIFLSGRFQYQNKFEQNNTRLTASASYRVRGRTWLRAEAGWAPPGDTVIANRSYALELSQGLPRGIALGGGYRFLRFQDARINALTAFTDWDARPDLHLDFHYTPARTRFHQVSDAVWNHGGSVRLAWDAHRAVSPYFLFAIGSESFAGLSAEQLGRFSARTYGGGIEWRMTRTQGWRVGYHFQARTQGRHEQAVEVAYYIGL